MEREASSDREREALANATNAKIAASEARTDSKFAELRGEIRLANAELGSKLDKVLAKVEGFDSRLSEHKVDMERRFVEQRSEFKADFGANRSLMIGLAVSVSAVMLAIMVAFFTIGGTMFSRGMQIRDVVKAVIAEQQQQAPAKSP